MSATKQKSENRRALPKFFLTMLLSLLTGGVIGLAVGLCGVFGLRTDSVAEGLNHILQGITPWAIPATSVLFLGGACLLVSAPSRSCRRKRLCWRKPYSV